MWGARSYKALATPCSIAYDEALFLLHWVPASFGDGATVKQYELLRARGTRLESINSTYTAINYSTNYTNIPLEVSGTPRRSRRS